MNAQLRLSQLAAFSLYCLLTLVSAAHAGTPTSDRLAVQAGVKTEIAKDLSLHASGDALRQNLPGRQAGGRFSGRHP